MWPELVGYIVGALSAGVVVGLLVGWALGRREERAAGIMLWRQQRGLDPYNVRQEPPEVEETQ